MEQNIFVHEKKILKDYADLAQLILSGYNNYIVIITNGYRTDDIALRAFISKQFAYMGLLGSKTKIEKMFASYKAEGISFKLLNKILHL